jgi:hypothetical protein
MPSLYLVENSILFWKTKDAQRNLNGQALLFPQLMFPLFYYFPHIIKLGIKTLRFNSGSNRYRQGFLNTTLAAQKLREMIWTNGTS